MSPLRLLPLLALLSLALRCQSVPLQLTLRQATSAISLSALPVGPGAAVALSGVVRICPADFPAGFTLSCSSTTQRARAAEFFADGRRVKVSGRSWYGRHELGGYFRSGEVVWEGFATGGVVRCLTSDGDAAQAEIRLAC